MNKHQKRQKTILPGALGVRVLTRTIKDKRTGKIETISDIGYALRSFKKEMKESGKLLELKERRYFVKKSEKKRVQLERAKYFQWVEDQNNQ